MLGCCPLQNQFQLSGNETQRQTEFLGVLAASQVDVTTLEEPLQALCEERSVHWTRRVEGESLTNESALQWCTLESQTCCKCNITKYNIYI